MEVGLSQGDFVLGAPLPQKGRSPPIFDPCVWWPSGLMDYDAT